MDDFNSMDRAPEQALEWASDKLSDADWAIVIIGKDGHWERGVFGVGSVHQFCGILEDVKITEIVDPADY